MAERYAVSAGNWVAARFNGGTLPGVGDTVHANGFAVTIDVSITVDALSTRPGATAVAGGSFTGSGAVTVTADTYGGATTCLSIAGIDQKQIGDSYGSITNNSIRGTSVTFGSRQIGNAYGGTGGSSRDGTIVTTGGLVEGDGYGSANNSTSAGVRCSSGGRHNGDSYGNTGPGAIVGTGGIQYGSQFGGSVSTGFGTDLTSGGLVITQGITDSTAKGLQANGASVILQNGVTSGQVTQIGTASDIGETLPYYPYVGGGSAVAGFTGIRGTHRTLGT